MVDSGFPLGGGLAQHLPGIQVPGSRIRFKKLRLPEGNALGLCTVTTLGKRTLEIFENFLCQKGDEANISAPPNGRNMRTPNI